MMLTTIQGIYRGGKIVLPTVPINVHEDTPVIVTFLEPPPYIYPTVSVPAAAWRDLTGILPPVGGDALADTEALYDEV